MSEKMSLAGIVLAGFTVLIIVKIYLESDWRNLTCIISTVDGNKYCVREQAKMDKVADLLAHTTKDLKRLVQYANEKYPDRDNVKRLVEGFNTKKIYEILPTSEYTAYSENKGEKLAFCTTKEKKANSELIDRHTLLFVGIHELSHIMTVSIGHKPEFWSNFKFLLELAKEAGIHEPKNYKDKPVEYCDMMITDNPYYDFE